MEPISLKFRKLDPRARLPQRATPGSAAADLRALLDAPLTLHPGERAAVRSGLAMELPSADYVALIFARSGNAYRHGVTLTNCVGVIDSDYRGELISNLINLGDSDFTIEDGDRIAQLMVTYAIPCDITESDSLSDTERGDGGFGSTGKK